MTEQTWWRSGLAFGFRAFIACGAAVILFELAAWAYPPVLPWGLALMGRMPMSSICSASNAFHGAALLQRQHATEKKIQAATRLVQDDGAGLRQWDTPDGKYWLPKGTDAVLPILLAQQELDIYAFPGKPMAAGEEIGRARV